jgi:hypothetical protein
VSKEAILEGNITRDGIPKKSTKTMSRKKWYSYQLFSD